MGSDLSEEARELSFSLLFSLLRAAMQKKATARTKTMRATTSTVATMMIIVVERPSETKDNSVIKGSIKSF